MATVQIQKTVSTTKTAIDLKQSLEVVQTMLHGSVRPPLCFPRGSRIATDILSSSVVCRTCATSLPRRRSMNRSTIWTKESTPTRLTRLDSWSKTAVTPKDQLQ